MPSLVNGSEWAAYYEELAVTFGLTIDATGPHFGLDHLLDVVSGCSSLATFVGAQTRMAWPAHQDLRRIPLRGPTPVYPHSLIWRTDNPHLGLAALRAHLSRRAGSPDAETWTPGWALLDGEPARCAEGSASIDGCRPAQAGGAAGTRD